MLQQLPIARERNLYLSHQIDQDSINELSRAIVEINKDDEYLGKLVGLHGMSYTPKPINLYIDSYGGQVYQCLGLIGIMDKSVVPVHTIVTGTAMSCGFIIGISGHKRYAYNTSTFMYHQVSGGVVGKLKDMEADVVETKRLQLILEQITLSKTKITINDLEDNYKCKNEWYITPTEALKLGIIDEIR
jgi:ATP-dependent Clp protease protease subunit